MGWAMLAIIALMAALLLWGVGFPRRLWTIAATGLTLGAAGYAWQGSPGLPGHPVAAQVERRSIDPELVAIRDAMFGEFNATWAAFMRADAMTRAGYPDTAARAMMLTVRSSPNDFGAWTWLGIKLAENDGTVSPPARFAFDRAVALNPNHPGPPFFLGVALLRENKFAEARAQWARAVALTPEKVSYRPALLARLFLLDQLIEAQAAAKAQRQR
jgi:cytochrome c-type biogenesis protein CcmH